MDLEMLENAQEVMELVLESAKGLSDVQGARTLVLKAVKVLKNLEVLEKARAAVEELNVLV